MSEEKKQTLSQMLSVLKIMEHDIDTSDEITLEMCDEHFAQIKSIDEKVDKLLGYMELAETQAESFKKRADQLSKRAKSWAKKYESLKDYAIYLANNFPEVQGRGNERTFYKRLNSPSLCVDIERKWSSDHVVADEFVNEVPEKYRMLKQFWVLDTAALKNDMKTGLEFHWAKLVRKENLKIEEKVKG